jgi:hypothetical protein
MTSKQICIASFAALAFAGCATGPGDSDDGTGDGDGKADGGEVSAATAAAAGYYSLAAAVQANTWIDDINLHADGTFEGDFGNGLSNFAGHTYTADGTFVVDADKGTISFNYTTGFGGPDVYSLKKVAGGIQIQHQDGSGDPAFTLTKGPSPATLTFPADAHPSLSGKLVPGDVVLIDYAVARSQCPVSSSLTESSVIMQTAQDGLFGAQQVLEMPVRAVDGNYRGLFTVPPGKTIAIWFQQVTVDSSENVTCEKWDSNNAANWNFTLSN